MKRVWTHENGTPLGKYEVDDLTFVRTIFKTGQSFTYFYPDNTAYSELSSFHYQVSGEFTGPFARSAGWRSDASNEKMQGLTTFTATSDAETWCIFGGASRIVLVTGEQALESGDTLFLLKGVFNENGPGSRFKVGSNKTLDFGTAVLAKWKVLEAQQTRDLAWEHLKYQRDQRLREGFTWNGMVFDSDPQSRANITDTVLMAITAPSMTIDWTLADNSVVTLTASDVIELGAALGMFVANIYDETRIAKEALTP